MTRWSPHDRYPEYGNILGRYIDPTVEESPCLNKSCLRGRFICSHARTKTAWGNGGEDAELVSPFQARWTVHVILFMVVMLVRPSSPSSPPL